MNVLILAAGFGTRLYPLTKEIPKALIKINGKTILEDILGRLDNINISNIFILSNWKFYNCFLDWANKTKFKDKIKIIHNGVFFEEDKKGAVVDLQYFLESENIEDMFILASDNLLRFDLRKMLDLSQRKEKSVVALKQVSEIELVKKYSCAELDSNKKIIFFEEKPKNPKSNLCVTACYFLRKEDLIKIKNNSFVNKDNMGNIIDFLVRSSEIYGVEYEDFWTDIGSLEELKEAENLLRNNLI